MFSPSNLLIEYSFIKYEVKKLRIEKGADYYRFNNTTKPKFQ